MRADDHVDAALAEPVEDAFLFGVGAETAQALDGKGELGQALAEGAVVLFGQHGGRHEHGHLAAVVDRLEGGADRQFGLAVADVAADEPVHGPRPPHVGLDLGQTGQLVGRLLVGERRLELVLPVRVRRQGDAGLGLTQGLQANHVAGHVEHGGLHLVLAVLPAGAADLGQLRLRAGAPDVFLDEINLRRRHRHPDAVAELELEELLLLAVLVDHLHAAVAGDAVADVDDQVALGQVEEAVDGPRLQPAPRQYLAHVLAVEQLLPAQHDHARSQEAGVRRQGRQSSALC